MHDRSRALSPDPAPFSASETDDYEAEGPTFEPFLDDEGSYTEDAEYRSEMAEVLAGTEEGVSRALQLGALRARRLLGLI